MFGRASTAAISCSSVESGEGIESDSLVKLLETVKYKWNPEKELKGSFGVITRPALLEYVESGEGIEREGALCGVVYFLMACGIRRRN